MKEKLINELVASLRGYIPDQELRDIKMKFSITMKDYEVSSAKHEVTVWKGDENEMMLRRFLAAKIAKGCSVRTIQFYKQSIAHTLLRIGKKYCDITSEDIRLYLAERVYKDGISKTTANNERRNLSSFFDWLQVEEILLKNPMKKNRGSEGDQKEERSFQRHRH